MNRSVEILGWIGRRIGKPRGWERVVRLFTSPERCRGMEDVPIIRDGTTFIAQPGVPLGWHIALFGTYEPELREIFGRILPAGGVVVDVGANVGWHTMLMARLVGESGRVFAAEANPSVRVRLEEHLHLNGLRQVAVLPFALGDRNGSVEFHAPGVDKLASGDGHVVAPGESGAPDVIRVEVRTLDDALESRNLGRLDLIKIDVEGFEWPVLSGADRSIGRFRPHVIFETIAEYLHRGGATPQVIAHFFAKHRYRLYAVGRSGARPVSLEHWPDAANLWAMPLPGVAASEAG
jgi:FkbM family methyltransferase